MSAPVEHRPGAPRIELQDSVILEETDSLFLGSPGTSLAVDEGGFIYVPDRSEDRILRFRPDGTLDRVIGVRGDGPGELRGVGSVIFANSHLVAVNGYRQLRVSVFESWTGRYLGSAHHQGSVRSLHIDGDNLWYGTMGNVAGKAVGRIDLKSVQGGGPPAELSGALVDVPAEYRLFPGLDVFDNVVVWADSTLLIAGFGGLDYLVVAGVDGRIRDTLHVPVRSRRGAPPDQHARYFRSRNLPAAVTFSAISSLGGMWRLRDGSLVLYHRDLEEEEPTARNSQTIGRAFISVLAPGFSHACVDAELPSTTPSYPRIMVQNDTVYQLEQVVGSLEGGRVQSIVRKYNIDLDDCDWIPLKGQ